MAETPTLLHDEPRETPPCTRCGGTHTDGIYARLEGPKCALVRGERFCYDCLATYPVDGATPADGETNG